MEVEREVRRLEICTSQPATQFLTLAELELLMNVDVLPRTRVAEFRNLETRNILEPATVEQLLERSTKLLSQLETGEKQWKTLQKYQRLPQDQINAGKHASRCRKKNFQKLENSIEKITEAYQSGVSKVSVLMRKARCGWKLAKQVRDFLDRGVSLDILSEEGDNFIEKEVQDSSSNLNDLFFTATSIKRKLQDKGKTVSRQRICRILRKQGYRYKKNLPDWRRKSPPRSSDFFRIRLITDSILSDFETNESILVFIDETKFQLTSVPYRIWKRKGIKENVGRNVDSDLITVIAACTVTGFEAVQLYEGEITSDDYLYFVVSLIERVSCTSGKSIQILQDGAKWHTSRKILQSPIGKYLLTNLKGYFDLNMIENAFSSVKYKFRTRPIAETRQQEYMEILKCFVSENRSKTFRGYCRNLIRSVIRRLSQVRGVLSRCYSGVN